MVRSAVAWEDIELPLSGVDQFTDAPHVLVSQLREATNVRFWEPPKAGKRYGFTAQDTFRLDMTAIAEGVRLHAHRKATLLCEGSRVNVQSEKSGRWFSAGRLSNCHVERIPVHHEQAYDRADADLAYNAGLMVVAWPAGAGELSIEVVDTNGDAIVAKQAWSSSTYNPSWVRTLAIGGYLYVFGDFNVSLGNMIKWTRIDTAVADYTFPTPTGITLTGGALDPVPIPDVAALSATQFVVAYRAVAGTQLFVERCDVATGTVQASYAGPGITGKCLAVEGVTGEGIWCAYENGGALICVVLDATTLAVVAGPTTLATAGEIVRVGITRLSATKRLIAYEIPTSGTLHAYTEWNTCDVAGTAGTAQHAYDVQPASKPFTQGGLAYIWTVLTSDTQPTEYLLEISDANLDPSPHQWAGTALRGTAKPPTDRASYLRGVTATDTNKWETAALSLYRVRFAGDADDTVIVPRAGIYRLAVDFGAEHRHEVARWGDSLFFAGSRPSMYDQSSAHECGFAWRPERMAAPATAFAGGHLVGGTAYRVVLVYEWEDALGQIHRSAPSDVIDYTLAAGAYTIGMIQINLEERLLASHGSTGAVWTTLTNVRCVPYRTIAGGAGNFYRDSTLGFDAEYNTMINVGAEFDDTSLALQDVLYITGDVLDNAGLPPSSLACHFAGRLFTGGGEDPQWLWFSQPYVEGEAPRFNEALRVLVGSKVRAMAAMDEKLIVFTDTEIYALVGQGPPATGGLDVGFELALVSSETGCKEPRSLCLTNGGLGFLGSKGYCLLTRGLQVEWIGLPVKNYSDAYPDVTSAVVTADGRFLRISARRNAGSSVWLVYDLTLKQWTFDITSINGAVRDAAIVWRGTSEEWLYAFVTEYGTVYVEDASTRLDAGAAVPWQITTAWIHRASLGANGPLQGWQFIKSALLFGYFSNLHALKVEVGYDFDNAWTTTYNFTAADLAALQRSQVEIDFEFMTCQAFRLRITEVFDEAGEDYEFDGPNLRSITIQAGFQRGPFRIQDAARH